MGITACALRFGSADFFFGSDVFLDVVLDVAIAGLHFAAGFFDASFSLQRSIAEKLADEFLGLAFRLVDSTFELMLVHDDLRGAVTAALIRN